MKKPSKKLINKTANEMWYWVRDRQKAACEKNGWKGDFTEHFGYLKSKVQNAWLLAAEWHLLNCKEQK
jgi:hypothetical protein